MIFRLLLATEGSVRPPFQFESNESCTQCRIACIALENIFEESEESHKKLYEESIDLTVKPFVRRLISQDLPDSRTISNIFQTLPEAQQQAIIRPFLDAAAAPTRNPSDVKSVLNFLPFLNEKQKKNVFESTCDVFKKQHEPETLASILSLIKQQFLDQNPECAKAYRQPYVTNDVEKIADALSDIIYLIKYPEVFMPASVAPYVGASAMGLGVCIFAPFLLPLGVGILGASIYGAHEKGKSDANAIKDSLCKARFDADCASMRSQLKVKICVATVLYHGSNAISAIMRVRRNSPTQGSYHHKVVSKSPPIVQFISDQKNEEHAKPGDILFVVSRGTASFGDAIKDLKAWKCSATFKEPSGGSSKDSKISLHSGFWQHSRETFRKTPLKWMFKNIRKKTTSDAGARLPIVFTGHSLGGAVAQILGSYTCSKLLRSAENRDIRIITFGSPLVFGETEVLRGVGEEMTIRHFVNQWDPVPYLLMILGYKSFGNTVYNKENYGIVVSHLMKNYLKLPNSSELFLESDC